MAILWLFVALFCGVDLRHGRFIGPGNRDEKWNPQWEAHANGKKWVWTHSWRFDAKVLARGVPMKEMREWIDGLDSIVVFWEGRKCASRKRAWPLHCMRWEFDPCCKIKDEDPLVSATPSISWHHRHAWWDRGSAAGHQWACPLARRAWTLYLLASLGGIGTNAHGQFFTRPPSMPVLGLVRAGEWKRVTATSLI